MNKFLLHANVKDQLKCSHLLRKMLHGDIKHRTPNFLTHPCVKHILPLHRTNQIIMDNVTCHRMCYDYIFRIFHV